MTSTCGRAGLRPGRSALQPRAGESVHLPTRVGPGSSAPCLSIGSEACAGLSPSAYVSQRRDTISWTADFCSRGVRSMCSGSGTRQLPGCFRTSSGRISGHGPMVRLGAEAYSGHGWFIRPGGRETMKITNQAHLVPALIFGGLLGVILVGGGLSLGDALLAVCGAYALVTLLEFVFSLDTS